MLVWYSHAQNNSAIVNNKTSSGLPNVFYITRLKLRSYAHWWQSNFFFTTCFISGALIGSLENHSEITIRNCYGFMIINVINF